jgi:hypothetical protein
LLTKGIASVSHHSARASLPQKPRIPQKPRRRLPRGVKMVATQNLLAQPHQANSHRKQGIGV